VSASALRQSQWDQGLGNVKRGKPALFAALCLLVLAGMAGSAAPAKGALLHSLDSYLGGGTLSSPEALAVDQETGDLYVLEHGSGCVARFHGERGGLEALQPHNFSATGTNRVCGLALFEEPSKAQIAVDNSSTSTQGKFYVNSPLHNGGVGAILGFDQDGNLETELSPQIFGEGHIYYCGVAVDADGNVGASEHYGGIRKFLHNDPVTDADYVGTSEEGPACAVEYNSTGDRYSSWDSNGPLFHAGTVLSEVSYALTVDRSSDEVYFSEGPVVRGIDSESLTFDEFGEGEVGEARGVAVDETNGVAYVADTTNGRVAVYQGTTAYRLGVDYGGTGLGAISADAAPIAACGDEGQCAGYYVPSNVVLTATPQPHSVIDGWVGCDSVNVAGDECSVEITNAARDVFATFTRLRQTVSAATTGTGTGTVSSSDPLGAIQGCGGTGGTCSGSYEEGSAVELVASPTGHSSFTGWTGDCTNDSGTCEVVVEGTPEVTAHFTAQHAVNVKKAGTGAGSVSSQPLGLECGGVCLGYFTDGDTITLSATPAGHSTFTGWSGEGCTGTGTCEVEIGGATKTVTANFVHDPPTATTGSGATYVGQRVATVSGTVDPNGSEVTSCVVEYGTTAFYGSTLPCAPSAVGSGDSPVPVGVDLSGLTPGSIYHFRFSAGSVGGRSDGLDQTFRTLDDTCDSNQALCPPRKPISRPAPKKCKKGFALKRGKCVKKKKRKKKARHKRGSDRQAGRVG